MPGESIRRRRANEAAPSHCYRAEDRKHVQRNRDPLDALCIPIRAPNIPSDRRSPHYCEGSDEVEYVQRESKRNPEDSIGVSGGLSKCEPRLLQSPARAVIKISRREVHWSGIGLAGLKPGEGNF